MRALSNNNSEIVERYSYDVFGEPNRTSGVGNPYFFTGREFDSETGLYYYRARYYSPEIGRFLQTDPIGYYDSMNLYEYCWNNPVNWVDPWGLDTLGIHSSSSHSWISYTDDAGNTSTYGLWRSSHATESSRLRPGTDVRKNIEKNRNAHANRYYNNLTERQKERFRRRLEKNHRYRYPTNNCSSWASDTAREVTGEDVDADNERLAGVETPGELERSIEELEKNDPTENEAAKKPPKKQG